MEGTSRGRRRSNKTYNDMLERVHHCLFAGPSIQTSSGSKKHVGAQLPVYPKPTFPTNHVTLEGFDPISQSKAISIPTTGTGISNALACVTTTVVQLQSVTRCLSEFPSLHEEAPPDKSTKNSSDLSLLAELARLIMGLAREAFVPAHGLCQTAIGLYMTEDLIRDPSTKVPFTDIFDRIKIPSREYNETVIEKLKLCLDNANQAFTSFKFKTMASVRRNGTGAEDMRKILMLMRHVISNTHNAAIGCLHLFDILFYIETDEQICLSNFLESLNSMEKSDLLEAISNLRRSVDHIPLLLEKLSWGSYTVYRLASGKSPVASPVDSGVSTPLLRGSFSRSKASLEMESLDRNMKYNLEEPSASTHKTKSKPKKEVSNEKKSGKKSKDNKRSHKMDVTECRNNGKYLDPNNNLEFEEDDGD